MTGDVQRIQSRLSELATQGADAAQISDAAIRIWHEVDATLSAVIGQRGFTALFNRSLSLTRAGHPWLAAVRESMDKHGEFTSLRAILSQQPAAEAANANGELLQIFADLLANLIGASLTQRLLSSVEQSRSANDSPIAKDYWMEGQSIARKSSR